MAKEDYDGKNVIKYKANGKKSLVEFKENKTPYVKGDVAKIDQPLAEAYREHGIVKVLEKEIKPKKKKEEENK